MNFDKINKFVSTNKYILLSILVIVVFFYIISPPFVEGFTADQYQYLAPIPNSNTWSQNTMTQFVDKWSTINNVSEALQDNAQSLKFYIDNTLEEEALYYIQNGLFPYDSYVTDYLNKNPSVIPTNRTLRNGTPLTPSNISQMWSNRISYKEMIAPIESKQTPPPISYQIYMGTIPDSEAQVSPITSSSLSSSSTLSESNYNNLVSLCKNIITV